MFEFRCTGGLIFDLSLQVCNYPPARENCAFLYTGEASDDGSYNENDLIRSNENSESSSLIDNEDSGSLLSNNESSELEAQPPERSSPVTEGSNVAAALSSEEDESSW